MEQDLSGQKIGEYEVVAPIGRGGMGIVYEGRQPEIGKRVALKVLLKAFSNQEDVVQRFLSEARAVNAIRHRGIVDIFSFSKLEDGTSYFVMEFLEGLPFDELIRTRAPLTPGDALRWTDEVLDALDAAHKAGVIHRDIKPSNLFLVDTGHGRPYVKLLDFGIAKLSSFKGGVSVGEASAVVGTPDYMAPEQARAKTISGATDLYAVGCVLFELLTRERVFEGMSAVDMMFAHVQKPARAPSTVQPGLPREVDDFVLKLLAKNPDDRPKGALAAREELHLLLRKLNEAPTLPPPSAYTVRAPVTERVPGAPGSATPMPGWNEDDQGRGQTWVTPAHGRKLDVPEAATQLSSGPIVFNEAPTDGAQKPTVPSPAAMTAVKQKTPVALYAGLGAVVLISAVAATLWARRPPPEPPQKVELPVALPVAVAVPVPVPLEPEPVAVVDAGIAAVQDAGEAAAPDAGVKVAKKGLTKEKVQEKQKRVAALLKKHEDALGQEDRTLHNLFRSAEAQLKTAKSPGELKDVHDLLESLQQQLAH